MTTAEILQLLREGSEFDPASEEQESVRNPTTIECSHCGERLPDTRARIRGARHRDSQLQPILEKTLAALELAIKQRDLAIQCATKSLESAEMNSNHANQNIVDLVKGMK